MSRFLVLEVFGDNDRVHVEAIEAAVKAVEAGNGRVTAAAILPGDQELARRVRVQASIVAATASAALRADQIARQG